jgi:pimeloyl-ACP methyl ester carboxylesterase
MEQRDLLGLSPAGFHRIVYTEWGASGDRPPVVCVHGLVRNGRDFDALAGALAGDRRVACPDVVGRGRSDWLPNPALYGYPQYCADMTALIARLGAEQVDWIGTSMGGLIGMMLAAQPKTPIRRLVMNDVGPYVTKAALERIAGYVTSHPSFPDLDALEAYLREIYAPFGPLTDAQWRHLAEHGRRHREDGTLGLAWDPALGNVFRDQEIEDVDMWPVWDRIRCRVLVLRGAESDVLTAGTAEEMTRRGPLATLLTFPGIGHAPPLMAGDQIAVVRDWLDG